MNRVRHLVEQMKQNKISLIVADFGRYGIAEDIVCNILLKRGVFKWFAVRCDLIRTKNEWKEDIKHLDRLQKEYKTNKLWRDYWLCKGAKKKLIECRERIRKLCHSDRCRAPDNDFKAKIWLSRRLKEV